MNAFNKQWMQRITAACPPRDEPPDGWVIISGHDQYRSGSPVELAQWLWNVKVLRRYIVNARGAWWSPTWILWAYSLAFGNQGHDHSSAYPGGPSVKEVLWMALEMHRDKEYRAVVQTVYKLGGTEKLQPLLPSNKPKSRRRRGFL